jgi:serine/threonine-protein kinase
MKMTQPRVIAAMTLLLGATLAPDLLAGATPQDLAAADALYNEATALMDKGKYAEACPKLVASQKLDPAIGTLLKLGGCFSRSGQTASAWASFHEAESLARKANDKRAVDAARWAKELDDKLAKLVIEAPAGLQIQRDGTTLDAGLFGTALPVDPGEHRIEATAPGKQAWSTVVKIEPGPSVATVRVPALEALPPPVAVPLSAAPTVTTPPEKGSSWGTQKTVALVTGGVGAVGLAVGAAFGGLTLAKTSDAKGHCSGGSPLLCDPTGIDLHGSAKTSANIANVALALGGAAVIAGVVVFVTAPSGEAPEKSALRVTVGPSVGGAWLRGEW